MRTKSGLMVLFTAASMAVTMPAAAQTPLLDTVKSHDPRKGPLSIAISASRPARTIDQLTDEADLVVHGVVLDVRPELNKEQTAIMSVCRISITRELLSNPRAPAVLSNVIAVQSVGGTMTLLGQVVSESDGALPPFQVGEEFVFFLKRAPGSQRFDILYANFGVFRVQENRLAAVGAARATHADFEGETIDALAKHMQDRMSTPR